MCKKIWTLFKMEFSRIWHDDDGAMCTILFPMMLPFVIYMAALGGTEYLQVAITEPLPKSLNMVLGGLYGISITMILMIICNCFSTLVFFRQRHNGELFPLLGSSTSRTSIAMTKLGTVCLHTLVVGLSLGVGFVLCFNYTYAPEADNLHLTLGESISACAVILSLSLTVATGMCLISALAVSKAVVNDSKSSLTVMLPLVSVIPIFANMTSSVAFQFLPVCNTASCLYDIWMKQVSYQNIIITCAVNLVCVFVFGYLICRAFHKPNAMLSTIPEEA